MNSLESVIAQIQGLSGTPTDLSGLHSFLKGADESLRAEGAQLLSSLDQLDPYRHTLGYLYLLETATSGPVSEEQAATLVLFVARFISSCDAQVIRLAPEKFVSLCKKFKDHVLLREEPMRGVAVLLTAIRKLQTSTEHLTTLHPEFLLLCLLSKCYKTGFSILYDDISDVDQPRDLFLYCYYGGMICIGQKQYEKAIELLHNVVTAPMNAINAIAVEAYKKYVLVSLIQNGQFSASLPKYTSTAAHRNLKNFCQTYVELASTYNNWKIGELETFVQTNREVFEKDNNLGLVKQVVSSMYRRNIHRLTQKYLTLSLEDIAKFVQLNGPKEAEMLVLQMIQGGQINAEINQKDGMVRFLEDPEQYKTGEMIEHIDSSIQSIVALSKKLKAMDERLSYDPLYLAKAGKERHRYDFGDDFDAVPQKFSM